MGNQTPGKQSPTDKEAYRTITLPNKLQVLLISDEKMKNSTVCLDVKVGWLADPNDRLGLAHFLEHVLFLGASKYPKAGEYQRYIESNGGQSVAYTGPEHTSYIFEIRDNAFEEAMDRFSQFFISPTFSPEFITREINAVNEEVEKNTPLDYAREFRVKFHTLNKDLETVIQKLYLE